MLKKNQNILIVYFRIWDLLVFIGAWNVQAYVDRSKWIHIWEIQTKS